MEEKTAPELTCPIMFDYYPEYVPVDEWVPEDSDQIFRTVKGYLMAPLSEMFGLEPSPAFDAFDLKTKRSYNNPEFREHCVQYLNYFEKFYDIEHELLMMYFNIKFCIDYEPSYTKEAFFRDLDKYIMRGPISYKIDNMVNENYSLSLTYKNKKQPVLQYVDKHAMLFMKISILSDVLIPLLSQFMFIKKISNSTGFLLEIYDMLFHMYPGIDLYNKLYETCISNILRSEKKNSLWGQQDIRGINPATHALSCTSNIILNILPRYVFKENLIHFNFKSIKRNTGFQVLDIEYEFAFIPLSSSKRDEDMNSEFDKFESFLVRTDQALYMQNKVNSEATMRNIELMYGPFDDEEIAFYMKALAGNKSVINFFQKDLIFNLFYKYFGDPQSANAINLDDYIKLMLAAKRILEASGMVLLPYIISGKVIRLATRKNVNKKELTKLEASPLYDQIKEKYKNDKIEKHILSLIAVILSSEIEIIDPDDPNINGGIINIIPELICEEILLYVTLI